MSRFDSASGYDSVAGSFWAPEKISTAIVYNYQVCAVTPAIARSDFLSESELFCGAKVIFGVEQDIDIFGMITDNNEDPETISGPGIDTSSMTICQQKKFKWKISNADKAIMCDNFGKWEAYIRRQISKSIIKLIDAYSIPKIIASASPHHTGNNAGILYHDVDLGKQDNTALAGNTKAGFEDMIIRMNEVAEQAGWNCGEGEIGSDGEVVGKAVVMIPIQLKRYALQNLKDLNQCCGENNAMIVGKITSDFFGNEIIVTRYLVPMNFGQPTPLVPVVMVDPNRILHAFDVITNKWYEGMYEDYLVGEFIWDTEVINPLGVIVAISKV